MLCCVCKYLDVDINDYPCAGCYNTTEKYNFTSKEVIIVSNKNCEKCEDRNCNNCRKAERI